MSTDRLLRVRENTSLPFSNVNQNFNVSVQDIIAIGDWCVFQSFLRSISGKFLVGSILSFKYSNLKGSKAQFKKTELKRSQIKKSVDCLANWYDLQDNGTLSISIVNKYGFCIVNKYIAHFPEPQLKNNLLYYDQELIKEIMALHDVPIPLSDNSPGSTSSNSVCSVLLEESDDSDIDFGSESEDTDGGIKIMLEQYYAVFYEEGRYLGRNVKKVHSNSYRMKFLREDLVMMTFYWPKPPDIKCVKKEQIIYGPVKLLGVEPLKLTNQDRDSIKKNYKNKNSLYR